MSIFRGSSNPFVHYQIHSSLWDKSDHTSCIVIFIYCKGPHTRSILMSIFPHCTKLLIANGRYWCKNPLLNYWYQLYCLNNIERVWATNFNSGLDWLQFIGTYCAVKHSVSTIYTLVLWWKPADNYKQRNSCVLMERVIVTSIGPFSHFVA